MELGRLFEHMDKELKSSKSDILPQTFFDTITRSLEYNLQNVAKAQWVRRPRLWFVLHQLKRHDTMDSFIAIGRNDTSFPFKRVDLPRSFTPHEVQVFQQWQERVLSKDLDIIKGEHIQLDHGDSLFDSKPMRLGIGSGGYVSPTLCYVPEITITADLFTFSTFAVGICSRISN